MKTLTVCAGYGHEGENGATLHITARVPDLGIGQENYRTLFFQEAEGIEAVLRRHLPSGTYNALLAIMLQKEASLRIAPFEEEATK